MDSRLRGNDINCSFTVIPAKAGIHSAYPNTNAVGRGFDLTRFGARRKRLEKSQGARLTPPSTLMFCPVMYEAPGESRNATTSATSSSPPGRARGTYR